MTGASRGFVLVVSLQPLDASTTLFFGHMARLAPGSIRVVEYGSDDVAGLLAAAAAVVFVRGLFEFSDLAQCARVLRIPRYYFLDDNFIVLNEQGGIGAEFVTRYSVEAVRAALRDFVGVLLASPALVSYFSEHGLHPRLFLFPPVMDVNRPATPEANTSGVTLAFFGGRHLHRQFLHIVVPAVRRLARQRPVRLVAVGLPESIPASEGLSVSQHPYAESYTRGLGLLAAEGVDVFLHPVAPSLPNNAYKNPHALISAHALGAIPIVSKAPPYEALGTHGVALTCDDNEESWHQALTLVVTDAALRLALRARLAAYCAQHFSGSANRDVVHAMLRGYAPRGRVRTLWRGGIARGCLGMSLAGRAAARVARATGLKASVVAA